MIDKVLGLSEEFDILIVDDNSPDGTAAIVASRLSEDNRIHLMKRAGKQGLGTAYIAGFKWCRKVSNTSPLSTNATEWLPGAEVQSDEQIIDYLKNNVESVYHPVGTCKMGVESDELAVVDNKLNVRGIAKLMVVDASVMPNIVGGNTNGPTIMIAEKAADIIKSELSRM